MEAGREDKGGTDPTFVLYLSRSVLRSLHSVRSV